MLCTSIDEELGEDEEIGGFCNLIDLPKVRMPVRVVESSAPSQVSGTFFLSLAPSLLSRSSLLQIVAMPVFVCVLTFARNLQSTLRRVPVRVESTYYNTNKKGFYSQREW